MTEIEKIQQNKDLCEKYPFLIPRSVWTGEIVANYDYSWTELDAFPKGWGAAFGLKMIDEINNILLSEGWRDEFQITDIKEKYGILCFYTNYTSKALNKVINKYEHLSKRTCIICGAPAKWISTGWISPFCEKCAADISDPYVDIDEF